MASLESLQSKAYAAVTRSGRVVDDKSIAIQFVHVHPTNTTPSVTVVSNTGITLASSGYTTGSLAFATYTNLGLLADKINSDFNLHWRARVLDGLRSTLTGSSVLIPNSAVTPVTRGQESIYEVYIDQSVNDSIFYRVAQDRGVLRDDNGRLKTEIPQGSHRVKINRIIYRADISAATDNGIRIYEWNPSAASETQIWGAKSVDDVATTHDFSDNPITSSYGNELVVMFNDSAISDASTNFLQVDYVRE